MAIEALKLAWDMFKNRKEFTGFGKYIKLLLLIVGVVISTTVVIWLLASSGTIPLRPVAGSSQVSAVGNLIQQLSFKGSAEGLNDLIRFDANWSNPAAFKNVAIVSSQGEHGVQYDLALDNTWQYYVIRYPQPVQGNLIIFQVSLSDTPDVEANWVGIQAMDSPGGTVLVRAARQIPLGESTQFTIDLRRKYDLSGTQLTDRAVNIEIFFGVKGKASMKFPVVRASIEAASWYGPEGDVYGPRLEQRGMGETLFDFEDEQLNGWHADKGTISRSSEASCRGDGSLKWEVQAKVGDKFFLETTKQGSAPQAAWVARIFLPDNAPDNVLWANLYTRTKTDFHDSTPIFLQKGVCNTLIWDTHELDWDLTKDSQVVGIQFKAESADYSGPIFIDDFQLFEK